MTNTSRASFAGLMCVAGGLLFTFYFIGINPLLRLLDSPFEPSAVAALKMLIICVTSLCLAGGSIGILALEVTGTGWKRAISFAGMAISLLGLTSYIVGSIYIYSFPERAFRQFFTPGGSILVTFGTLLLATAVLAAKRWRGCRAITPLLAGLYFPAQFPLQALIFLGRGKGPLPALLGAWGIFWVLLGYAIWSEARSGKAPWIPAPHLIKLSVILAMVCSAALIGSPLTRAQSEGHATSVGHRKDGKRLFERETFGGNGRTCLTCHSAKTGTVSPEDAQERFRCDPKDPLFLHDGSDDRQGNGVYRMLKDATILVEVPLPENVSLADDPTARSVILARGIPSTLKRNGPILPRHLRKDAGRCGQALRPLLRHSLSNSDQRQTAVLPDRGAAGRHCRLPKALQIGTNT